MDHETLTETVRRVWRESNKLELLEDAIVLVGGFAVIWVALVAAQTFGPINGL